MTDFLDLPGWRTISIESDDSEYAVTAEYLPQPVACIKCSVVGNVYRHGPKPVAYWDAPVRGRHVRIIAKVQRYKCRDCSATFLQPISGIHPDMRMTARCVEYIQEQCLNDQFIRIADHIGCDDKTVRNIANDHIARLNAEYDPELPEWLGIDETQIDGQLRCVITDVGNRRIIEMLEQRDQKTIATWLQRVRGRQNVKGIAMDMWRPYRDLMASMFPGVPVVVDKFHVVRMASYGVDLTRIRLAKGAAPKVGTAWKRSKHILQKRDHNLTDRQRFELDMWLKNEPELAESHRAKEAFYAIYDMPKNEAIKAYDAWPGMIHGELRKDFKALIRAAKNWRTQILNYFDYPITNGYTEGINGQAKALNREGRGYSHEVLRARMLFSAKKQRRKQGEPMQGSSYYERPKTQRSMLLKEHKSHCMSCGGFFPAMELHVTHMPPLVEGEAEVKDALICTNCKRRFHTERSISHSDDSTR